MRLAGAIHGSRLRSWMRQTEAQFAPAWPRLQGGHLVWALAPMPSVMLISSIVGLAAFALVGLAAFALVTLDFMRRVSGGRASVARPQASEATLVKRILLGTLLLSLGSGVTIFLVDYIWGDAVSLWVGTIFSIVISSLVAIGSVHLVSTRLPFAPRQLVLNSRTVTFRLGFSGLDAVFYRATDATVLTVVSLHKSEEIPQPAFV